MELTGRGPFYGSRFTDKSTGRHRSLCCLHSTMAPPTDCQVLSIMQLFLLDPNLMFNLIWMLLGAPDTLISNTDGRDVFSAGGLKFQMIEPMRRWRIIFNGFAKRISNGVVCQGHKHSEKTILWKYLIPGNWSALAHKSHLGLIQPAVRIQKGIQPQATGSRHGPRVVERQTRMVSHEVNILLLISIDGRNEHVFVLNSVSPTSTAPTNGVLCSAPTRKARPTTSASTSEDYVREDGDRATLPHFTGNTI